MSNIAFITTKKHIKSYNILELLQQINNKRFDGKLNITGNDRSWRITYTKVKFMYINYTEAEDDSWDGIDFYLHGKRKIGSKHPHTPWWEYVMIIFHEELASMINGTLSDEGVNEHWEPNPQKYSSYKNWLKIKTSWFKNKNNAKQVINADLAFVPNGLEKY